MLCGFSLGLSVFRCRSSLCLGKSWVCVIEEELEVEADVGKRRA